MLNISKNSAYIPNLIISSIDSIYDQFQMITENFNFYLEKCLSYKFHIWISFDKHFYDQKLKNDFNIMLNISKSSDYIPNLIISSFDFFYDQFQMITENFNFISKNAYHTNFIYGYHLISIFTTKN